MLVGKFWMNKNSKRQVEINLANHFIGQIKIDYEALNSYIDLGNIFKIFNKMEGLA